MIPVIPDAPTAGAMPEEETPPHEPSLPWRIGSSAVIGVTGGLCRAFLYTFNKTEAPGSDRFLKVLEERNDPEKRTRGLLTG